MAEPGEAKDCKTTDPVGAANSANRAEPLATEEDIDYVDSTEQPSSRAESMLETKQAPGRPQRDSQVRPQLQNVTRSATTASGGGSVPDTDSKERVKKSWYKSLNPLKRGPKPPLPKERAISREYTANFWSMLTFRWMAPVMSVGYKRTLEHNDIWLVNPRRKADVLTDKVQESFKRRVATGDRYPLLWAIHDALYFEFWVGGLCQLSAQIFSVFSPFTLRYLITFATEAYDAQHTGTPAPSIGKGIGLVLGITAMQMLQSLGTNHFIYRGMLTGGESRAILIAMIFQKSMHISGRARAGGEAIERESTSEGSDLGDQEPKDEEKWKKSHKGKPQDIPDKGKGVAGDGTGWANGRVVNLMSVDTYRVDQAM